MVSSSLPLAALAAGGGISPLVADLGLCLVAAGVLAIAFVKLKIPAIAALLGAGVLLVRRGCLRSTTPPASTRSRTSASPCCCS